MKHRQAQLPEGWEVKKLGDIGKVSMCKRVLKEDTTPEGDIPFYKIGTFGKSPDAFITKERYIEFRTKFSFPKKGDILISASGTIGRCVRYDGEPAYFQDSNIVWINNDEKQVLNDYLYCFYEICDWQSTKGATISRLYNDNLKQIEIPFPKSLPEQQRIVAILDEAFAAIAKAKSNAEQNLRNAKELFEGYLQRVFENRSEGWKETTLGEVLNEMMTGPFGSMLHKSDYVERGLPVINPQNIVGGKILPLEKTMIDDKTYERLKKYSLKEGDIVMARRGEMGRCAIVEKEHVGWLCGTGSVVIRGDKKKVNQVFLNVYLSSAKVKSELEKASTGATMSNLNQSILSEVKINLPSLIDQQTIVQKLDDLAAETQKLEAIYQQKVQNLEELKKSILQKAFSGELKTTEMAVS